MSSEDRPLSHRSVIAGCAVILLLSGGIAACPGSLDTDEFPAAAGSGATGGCGDVPSTILKTRCATSVCHDASSPAGSLDLTNDNGLVARLVDVDPTDPTCAGTGKIVDKADVSKSLLYTKCGDAPPCGTIMPQTGQKLSAADKQCLLDWITSITAQ